MNNVNYDLVLAGAISHFKSKLEEEHPNHCTTCNGQAGHVVFIDNEPQIIPCPDCYGAGLDPLDTTSKLDGQVSPSVGVDLLDPNRSFNLITDMIAEQEDNLYAKTDDCVPNFSTFFNHTHT